MDTSQLYLVCVGVPWRCYRRYIAATTSSAHRTISILVCSTHFALWSLNDQSGKISAKQLTKIFGRRMTIEEHFRDAKSKHNGFALKLTGIKNSDGLSRFLLVLALAYLLLVTIGLYSLKQYHPIRWCSNNRRSECGLFCHRQSNARHSFTPSEAVVAGFTKWNPPSKLGMSQGFFGLTGMGRKDSISRFILGWKLGGNKA